VPNGVVITGLDELIGGRCQDLGVILVERWKDKGEA